LHRIGEDVAERLDIVSAQLQVLVVRRPKYACRACEDGVVQAPAPVSRPSTLASSAALAESMMTDTPSVASNDRNSRSRAKPSSFGIITSVSSKSGRFALAEGNASSPSCAVTT
jgi:hypothetical protein